MDEFKIGDVVILKSGGPLMTVERIEKSGNYNLIVVVWFDDNEVLHRDAFEKASLIETRE